MKNFDYETLNHFELKPELVNKLTKIYELRGQVLSYDTEYRDTLDRLIEVAKIQSTTSSNRIEGIYTTDSRLNQLMAEKTMPKNRNEREISGYRDVLALIHESNRYIPVTTSNILTMHKRLFQYSESSWGGHFKDIDNQIVSTYADGHQEIRFEPPKAYLTPDLIEELCQKYNQAMEINKFSPLILAAAFTFDFVSIHPFRDGNGRMSRLLMLLTLYKSGFDVGKYISLEKIIEDTKEEYYAVLKESSLNWFDNKNDYYPFINYFLSIILKAYRDLIERISNVNDLYYQSPEALILRTLQQELRPLARKDLEALIPQYSNRQLQRALLQLRKEEKITLIGRGRNTKYILNH